MHTEKATPLSETPGLDISNESHRIYHYPGGSPRPCERTENAVGQAPGERFDWRRIA